MLWTHQLNQATEKERCITNVICTLLFNFKNRILVSGFFAWRQLLELRETRALGAKVMRLLLLMVNDRSSTHFYNDNHRLNGSKSSSLELKCSRSLRVKNRVVQNKEKLKKANKHPGMCWLQSTKLSLFSSLHKRDTPFSHSFIISPIDNSRHYSLSDRHCLLGEVVKLQKT